MNNKNFTVKHLQTKLLNNPQIAHEIDKLLKTFHQCVLTSIETYLTDCEVRVVGNFNIRGMTNTNAQLVIYAGLIQELESRGFTVCINTVNKKWKISGWGNNISEKAKAAHLRTIVSKTGKY